MDRPITCHVQTRIPSEFGTHRALLYSKELLQPLGTGSQLYIPEGNQHVALVFGNYHSETLLQQHPLDTENSRKIRGCDIPFQNHYSPTPLVRIHSCCFTGETLGSLRCDCAEQLQEAMKLMSEQGGVVVYLKQEGRGIGLLDKMYAYNLIDNGYDTLSANLALGHEADCRCYDIASWILRDLGIKKIKLLTNNPDKIRQIQKFGIQVDSVVPMVPKSWNQGEHRHSIQDRDIYLRTKVQKMGHLLNVPNQMENSIQEQSMTILK